MSDYLFDPHGDGELDPEVAQLEALLSPLAHRGTAPQLPRALPIRRRAPIFATTALLAAGLAAVLWVTKPKPPVAPAWAMNEHERLTQDTWLETTAPTKIFVDTIGTIELSANARARIVAMGEVREVELTRGTLSAHIAAPARHFIVHTPHVNAIDLGCAFSIALDDKGVGTLVVTEGAVALADHAGYERKVAAGFDCSIEADGPGIVVPSALAPAARDALLRYAHDRESLDALLGLDADTLRLLAPVIDAHGRAAITAQLKKLEAPHVVPHAHVTTQSTTHAPLHAHPVPNAAQPHPFFDGDR
jgi:hypothetical protein